MSKSIWRAVGAVTMLTCLALPAFATGFERAQAGYRYAFPRDHANHPGFKTEWWYYTGRLEAESGTVFGYQLTFFRVGVRPGRDPRRSAWRVRDLHMAHLAIADVSQQQFNFFERLARGDVGLAHSDNKDYLVYNGDWSAQGDTGRHQLHARQGVWGLDLQLDSQKAPIRHGIGGISRKGDCEGCASHYYSLTRMATRGTLKVNGVSHRVRGESWMDHEFGSGQSGPELAGWDWFSVQLNDRSELMIYRLRDRSGRALAASGGTFVAPDGRSTHLSRQDIRLKPLAQWVSPHSRAQYPISWHIDVPRLGLTITSEAELKDAELRTPSSTRETYWEGLVRYTGTRRGKPIAGHGYVEMTGYAGAFRARL